MSPRKVRLVIDVVRGMSVDAAIHQLTFNPKEAARPVLKLLRSAIANAEHNHGLDPKMLRIAKITADGGPVLHRWRARAHGRAAPIRKRTSHVQIILSDESPADVHRSQVKGGRRKRQEDVKAVKTTSKRAGGNKAEKERVGTKSEKAPIGAHGHAPKEGVKKVTVKRAEKKPAAEKASKDSRKK
jgi:large subunit ribosomal protein L22